MYNLTEIYRSLKMLLLLVVYRIKPKKNGKLNTIKFLPHLFSHQETTNWSISFFPLALP